MPSTVSNPLTIDKSHSSPLAATATAPTPLLEHILVFAVCALGGFCGSLIRIGFQYYRGGGPSPAAFTVMYAQLLGCFLMGFISEWQAWLMAGPRVHRLLYIGVASGLCGSITTLSAWMFESTKLGFLQLDASFGSIGGTYHGGRFFEWALAIFEGLIVPYAALHGGKHLGQAMQEAAAERKAEARRRAQALLPAGFPELPLPLSPAPPGALMHWHAYAEAALLSLFVVSTIIVVAVPVTQGWEFIAWACGLGAVGAYARYLLSHWNKAPPALLLCGPLHRLLGSDRGLFPLGTFAANSIGSWALAAAIAASKERTSYHDIFTQSILYGLATGFCGCLTTMSTFVLELHNLPRTAGYFYAALSLAFAQLGWALLFTAEVAPLAAELVLESDAPGPLAPCTLFPLLCGVLLNAIQCPAVQREVLGCSGGSTADALGTAFVCSCGALRTGERLAELLIDVQTKNNISDSLVPVFPSPIDARSSGGGAAFSYREPLESIDWCLSFENLCDHALARLSCPPEKRSINACNRRGLSNFVGECSCGRFRLPGAGNGVDGRVSELLIDHLFSRRYDFRAIRTLDYCGAVGEACSSYLDHVMCPPAQRTIVSCSTPGNLQTFEGKCQCFGREGPASNRIPQTVMDSFFSPNWHPRLLHAPNASLLGPPFVNSCESFSGVCAYILQVIGCPAPQRSVSACGNSTDPSAFVGECSCGSAQQLNGLLSTRAKEYIIEGVLAESLEAYLLIPPPAAPYPLMAASSPFRQLLAPLQPLPGSNL
jgi:CrcB protein